MNTVNFSPRFITANIKMTTDSGTFDLGEHFINASGIPAFPWEAFDPMLAVGQRVTISVMTQSKSPYKFACGGLLTCEQSESSKLLGVELLLSEPQKTTLQAIISTEGSHPDFVRKSPRIVFTKGISVMPSKAIVRFLVAGRDTLVCADLDTLSPVGLQISTEDPRCATMVPGYVVSIQLMPRGSFFDPIYLDATIRRVIRSVDAETGNLRWLWGLSLEAISYDQKKLLSQLLREIVLKAQNIPHP